MALIERIRELENELNNIKQEAARADLSCASVANLLTAMKNSHCLDVDDGKPRKVNIIKAVREATGVGLREAKDCVDLAM